MAASTPTARSSGSDQAIAKLMWHELNAGGDASGVPRAGVEDPATVSAGPQTTSFSR